MMSFSKISLPTAAGAVQSSRYCVTLQENFKK